MSGSFDEHDDFELARRLRRAAGPTPDVYVAYDDVVTRVGTVRRRRRIATTSTAAVVLLFAGAYSMIPQDDGRRITNADATTEPSITVDGEDVTPSTIGGPTTTEAPTGIDGDGSGVTTTTEAAPTTTLDATTTVPATVEATVAPTIAAPVDTAPPTTVAAAVVQTTPPTNPPATKPKTSTPKPTPTAPPVQTVPETVPATLPPETTPPETVPPEATLPPETTVPPTAPPPTEPPPTAPPATEPTVPVPVVTETWVSPEGNTLTARFGDGQLSIVNYSVVDGWTLESSAAAGKTGSATFTGPGGVSVRVNVWVQGSTIKFGVG